MASTFLKALATRDLRRKMLFVLGVLAIYRLGAYIPAPDINSAALAHMRSSNALGLFSMFTGGTTSRFPVFALGIMPFISASIVMQILGVAIPKFEAMRKDGEVGQARITQYSRYLTVGLAVAQSLALIFVYRSLTSSSPTPLIPHFGVVPVLLITTVLTSGATFLMWMGERITKLGVGNGISLILVAGIFAKLPHGVDAWWNSPSPTVKIVTAVLIVLVLAAVVFVSRATRRIPIQYATRVISARMHSDERTYLPLKVNMAGVVPVIFASSTMSFPPMLSSLIHARWAQSFATTFSAPHWQWWLAQSLLIMAFTYFYTAVTFNPTEQADNLNQSSAFVPRIGPGRPTALFLGQTLSRLTFSGAIFLAVLAAVPVFLISALGATFTFASTSVIIVVTVSMDCVSRLEALVQTQSYDRFTEWEEVSSPPNSLGAVPARSVGISRVEATPVARRSADE